MQILNISKLRNGIGILKKQENITENLTAEENRKEITETREETCTQTGTKECNSHKEENRRGSRERRKRRKG